MQIPKAELAPKQDHGCETGSFSQAQRVKDSQSSWRSQVTLSLTECESILETSPLSQNFLALTQGMQGKPLSYEGGAGPRPKELKNSDIYFASAEPEAYTIELHNEMAYLKTFPKKVFLD